MKTEDKIKAIKKVGRGSFMIHQTKVDGDGDPCVNWVKQSLISAYELQGWKKLSPPPVEAKKTRKPRKPSPKKIENEKVEADKQKDQG